MNTLCVFPLSSPATPRLAPLADRPPLLGRFPRRIRNPPPPHPRPARPSARATVAAFPRCGDLAAGFTRLHCPDCGHEQLLAFTCKGRHFCPACHQRRVLATGDWIARSLCRPVPHRQFVFTMPRLLRGIFRKRRELLHHLFRTAIDTLRDWFRARLDLPDGRLAAVAAVHTFGDYLVFHPHLHVLAACGLFDAEGRFHLLPVESLEPLAELFRHRFLAVLRREKLISEKRLRQLLGWAHSGFHLDAGKEPVAAGDVEGRRRLAEYLLRAPFSLQKITWKPETATVIYRSRRNWRTKRNFEVFKATVNWQPWSVFKMSGGAAGNGHRLVESLHAEARVERVASARQASTARLCQSMIATKYA